MRKLIIHTKPAEKSGVVIEDGEIREYMVDRPGADTLTGSIFVGKIERLESGLGAAFVDIGKEQSGFLRKEMIPWCKGELSKALHVGEKIIVQAVKDPVGKKGAQLTADVTFPGLYSVYQPFSGGEISISRKLEEDKRKELKTWLDQELEGTEGCIIRTAAGEVSRALLMEELRTLRMDWLSIQEVGMKRPGLLWKEPLLPDGLLRKFPVTTVDKIVIDDGIESKRLKEKFPSLKQRIQLGSDVEDELPETITSLQEQLVEPYVQIAQGAGLVIEETEAMTVIDVNSHQIKGRAFTNSQALEVNLWAAREIQKQIRLRNLSGMIVIDFISMKNDAHEKKLVREMRKLMKKDPVKTNVLGMTRLGLLEITRKRESASLSSLLAVPKRVEFTKEAHVFRLERELLKKRDAEALIVAVHPKVAECKKQLLSESISSRIPQELFVRQDANLSGYQIELEGSLDMIREAVQRRGYHVDNLF